MAMSACVAASRTRVNTWSMPNPAANWRARASSRSTSAVTFSCVLPASAGRCFFSVTAPQPTMTTRRGRFDGTETAGASLRSSSTILMHSSACRIQCCGRPLCSRSGRRLRRSLRLGSPTPRGRDASGPGTAPSPGRCRRNSLRAGSGSAPGRNPRSRSVPPSCRRRARTARRRSGAGRRRWRRTSLAWRGVNGVRLTNRSTVSTNKPPGLSAS